MAVHTDNSIVIAASLDYVWTVANKLERWPELFDEYADVSVLEESGDRIVFQLTTAPGADGRAYRWISERILDPVRRSVTARRLDTGPFRYMHLFQSFTLIGAQRRTLLRWVQDFEVRPEAPFTDAQMADRINRSAQLNLSRHRVIIEDEFARFCTPTSRQSEPL
jgi:aromatase